MYLTERGQKSYIKPQIYEQSKNKCTKAKGNKKLQVSK